MGSGIRITDLRLRRLIGRPDDSGSEKPWWLSASPPLDDGSHPRVTTDFLEVCTDVGVTGIFGPLYGDPSILLLGAIRTQIIGLDPLASERILQVASRASVPGHPNQIPFVVGALDCALWDLRGKILGRPVFQLLGGPLRETVPCYASLLAIDPDAKDAWKLAEDVKTAGFVGQKWGLRAGADGGVRTLQRNVDCVLRLREWLGADYPIMIDALGSWSLPYALRFCARVGSESLTWLEEPLAPGRVTDLADLRARSPVPIAAGEHNYSEIAAQEHLRCGSVDFYQPDVAWCGLTVAYRIVCIARAWDVPVVFHGNGLMPALHLAAAHSARDVPMLEYHATLESWRQFFLVNPLVPVDGQLTLPLGLGLGIDIDEGKLADSVNVVWPA